MAEQPGINPTETKDPRPKRFFGVRPTEHSNPFLATYDYTHKYPEDARYHELDDDARVWAVYNDEAKIYDADIVAEAGESLDVILIFAGLFASVLATFVAQSSQALAPDSAAISVSILRELADIQRAQSNGTAISAIPRVETQTTSSPSDIWVNGLWFTSLVLSLSTALIAVLAKQWLRQYLSVISGSQKNRALIHYFRRTSFDKWKVRGIIGFLPTLLHVALFLFLAGLVVQLYGINKNITFVVLGFTAALGTAYVFALLTPIFDPTCPYQTTLTNALLYPWTFALTSKTIRRMVGWPSYPLFFDYSVLLKAAAAQPVRNREQFCSTRDTDSQMFCFRPLLWMDHTTSNPSARIIILDAVSAITEPVTKAAVSKDMDVNERADGLLRFHNAYDHLGQAFAEKANILERLFRAIDLVGYRSMFLPVLNIPLDIEDTQLALTALSTQSFSVRLSNKTGSVHTFNVRDDPESFLPMLLDSFSLDELPSLPALIWARFPVRIPGPEDDCTPGFLEFVASYAQHERSDSPMGFMRLNNLRRGNLTIREYLVPLVTAAGWFSEKYRYRITPLPPDGDGSLLVEPRPLSFDHIFNFNPSHPEQDHSCSIRWHLLYPQLSQNVDEELYRCMLGDFEIPQSPPIPVNRTEWIRKARAKLKAWRKGNIGSRKSGDQDHGGGSKPVELSLIV